jgi:putative transposase
VFGIPLCMNLEAALGSAVNAAFPHAGRYDPVFRGLRMLRASEKEFFTRTLHAYARLLGIEVLTHCTMSNHFHLLLRVPPPPAAGTAGPTLDELLTRLEAAVGAEQMRQIRKNLDLWQQNGAHDLIDAWRQRQADAMYSLSEYMKRVKQRFTRWYNKRSGRVGIFWEDRYRSTIVQDEHTALRMMATYIDLNPVRAGITDDPGTYRWSGYAEAMSGKAEALEGLARITGRTAERTLGRGLGKPAPVESTAQSKRRHLTALVHYRQMLGLAGRPRTREDGKVIRRGVSARVQARLEKETGVREQLLQRMRHFTRGVIFGSREFINEWFERNRTFFKGISRENRKSGARPLGKRWKGFYNLRQLRQ